MKKNKVYLILIILLVIVILFSNVGESFKDDIFSYDNTNLHFKNINKINNHAKNHQEFIDLYSNYIINVMSYYKVVPMNKSGYFTDYHTNIAEIKYPSCFEVYSPHGKLIKEYKYNIDFMEDFKGNITSGIVKSNFLYADNFNTIANNPNEIVLYDGYKNKTNFEIMQIDTKLKSLGVSGIISPSYTNDLKYDSYINGEDLSGSNRGLAKFIVKNNIFQELKYYSQLGYAIKIKNGATMQNIRYRNIYGVIKGKNPKYKPLIVVTYYNDEFNSSVYKNTNEGAISTSLILDCIRSINFQRLNKPDRTVIFALLPRSNNNQFGFEYFLNEKVNGDTIILNNMGTGNGYILSYTKDNNLFCNTIEKLLNENKFDIISKSMDMDSKNNYLLVDFTNPEYILKPTFDVLSRSSKFFLSIIQGECYNLDFLSGNIREIRSIKKFINRYSIAISIFVLFLVLLMVFKDSINSKENIK